MAVDYATQVCVIIFYQDGRRLDYAVTVTDSVSHGDILEDAVATAVARAAHQFIGDRPAVLDFAILATSPDEYRRYFDKEYARSQASLTRFVGRDQVGIDINGEEVAFPRALVDIAQAGVSTVFLVETERETYLLEAHTTGVVLLFIGKEPSTVFYDQTPGQHYDALPTGEAFPHIVLPPDFSMAQALRPLMEHLASRD